MGESTKTCTLGARLAEERETLDMTQSEMAEIGGVTKNTQIAYEKDRQSPDAAYLLAIAEKGADAVYILTGRRGTGTAGLGDEVSPLEVNDAGVPYGPGLNIEVLRQIIEELERQLALEAEKEEPLTMTPYKKALAISMLYQRYVSRDAGAEIAGIERGVRDLLTLLR